MSSDHAHVVLVFHEKARGRDLRRYAVTHLAKMWREDGLRVTGLFGTREFVPADLALLHVDLSVVPERYIEFARRYPIALNTNIPDVRKSTLSPHLAAREDAYEGPVMVKTDFNCGGHPERANRAAWQRWLEFVSYAVGGRARYPIRHKREYVVFERAADVPDVMWRHPTLVVERFLPERTKTGYAVRNCCLLGDRSKSDWLASPVPVVSDDSATEFRSIDTDDGVFDIVRKVRLDFGKIDYTIHDGDVVVLDVNKTVGASIADKNPHIESHRRIWAPAIHDYLEGRTAPR